MRPLDLQAIYHKPRLRDGNPRHSAYHTISRGLTINRANRVWCADIAYIPVHDRSCTWERLWTAPAGGC